MCIQVPIWSFSWLGQTMSLPGAYRWSPLSGYRHLFWSFCELELMVIRSPPNISNSFMMRLTLTNDMHNSYNWFCGYGVIGIPVGSLSWYPIFVVRIFNGWSQTELWPNLRSLRFSHIISSGWLRASYRMDKGDHSGLHFWAGGESERVLWFKLSSFRWHTRPRSFPASVSQSRHISDRLPSRNEGVSWAFCCWTAARTGWWA